MRRRPTSSPRTAALGGPGQLTLMEVIRGLTAGPTRVLAGGDSSSDPGFEEGGQAGLVVFDRSSSWEVTPSSLRSRGKNTPLLGRELQGRDLLTTTMGFPTYRSDELAPS